MTISGGAPRDWIRSLRSDGNLRPNARGCHRGPAESLNVVGAIPGMVYYWCRHPKRDRGGAMLQRFVNQGWEVVPPGSPEHKSRETSLNYSELGLDGYQVHGDLVLVRIPEGKYREICTFRKAQADVARDATDEYLDKARQIEERYGARADGPIYYRSGAHGSVVE
jgi:hypothetical protein